jgi:hypothetical protein
VSRKFRNVPDRPRVAFLVDDTASVMREEEGGKVRAIHALS